MCDYIGISFHTISHGKYLRSPMGNIISYNLYTSLQGFHLWVPGPRPCRRYPPRLGVVDPPHLGGVQSGPRCRSRPLPLPRHFFFGKRRITR